MNPAEKPAPFIPSAAQYILDNFELSDRIAMLVLNRDFGETTQRITNAQKAGSPEFQAWLRYKNANGADIYVTWNRTGVCSSRYEPRWERFPAVAGYEWARRWSTMQANRMRARNRIDSYSRSMEDFLRFVGTQSVSPESAKREHVAEYLRDLLTRENPAEQPIASRGALTIWRTAIARMTSSIRAHTAWLALAVGSTVRKIARQHFFLRARKTCLAFGKTSL